MKGKETRVPRPVSAPRPLKVLVVTPFATLGGAEGWLRTLLVHMDAVDVEIVALQDGPFVWQLRHDGHGVWVMPTGAGPVALTRSWLRLTSLLRVRRPDVVLGNGVKAQFLVAPAGLLMGVPTVWAKHDHSFDRTLGRTLGLMSTRVVAAVEELGEPVHRRDVVVVPPPLASTVPASRNDAVVHLRQLGLTADDRLSLVMAGRLVPYKGVDDAIVALSMPKAARWRLVVIGVDDPASPGEAIRLQALARARGVDDRVTWLPHVPDVARWLSAFDCLAVLTKPAGRRTPGKEGFGTVAFEAMVAGVPVIAVRGGAVVRRLAGRAGLGVPAAAPGAVADALGVLSDKERRVGAGIAGRELTQGHPTALQAAATLVGVLEGAASRPASLDQRIRTVVSRLSTVLHLARRW